MHEPEDGIATAATEKSQLGRDDIEEAVRRLAGRVWRTPVVRCDQLDALAGARLWLKAENLQRGGSFKIRGALLALERLAAARSRGVVAQSTGNHAIAVALAARENGLPAVLILPNDAVPAKVRLVEEAGAEIIFAGTLLAERVAKVGEIRDLRGYDVVDPYQNRDVVLGQGTATAELMSQVAAEGSRLDAVVVPVGGGSAIAGACLASAAEHLMVIGAEADAVPSLTAAIQAGGPVTVPAGSTIADGLRPDRIGSFPFRLAHRTVASVITVSESAIEDAFRTALLCARLLIEPAAATALAAALDNAPDFGADVGVLLTGGNVETSLITSLLNGIDVKA